MMRKALLLATGISLCAAFSALGCHLSWTNGPNSPHVPGIAFVNDEGTLTLCSAAPHQLQISRSGDFTTEGLTFEFHSQSSTQVPLPGSFFNVTAEPMELDISGRIPAGTPCYAQEVIVIELLDVLGRRVLSTEFRIRANGFNPELSINGVSSVDKKNVSILSGCGSTVLTSNDPCQPQQVVLSIAEVNGFQGLTEVPGTEVFRALNASERASLYGTGLTVTTFVNGSDQITLSDNKHYRISLILNVHGWWVPTHRYLHIKPGTWDLYMQDNERDDGFEPQDKWDHDIYASHDLWNKRSNTSNQGTIEHEEPEYVSVPGNTNKIFGTIRNRGCAASPAGENLFFYWTRARLDERWNQHWIYDLTQNSIPSAQPPHNPVPGGSEITIIGATQTNPYNNFSIPFSLPSIPAGGDYQIPFVDGVDWFPPNPIDFNATNGQMSHAQQKPILCLLARLIGSPPSSSAPDKIIYQPTGITDPIHDYVKNNNNVVTRNSIVVDADPTFRTSGPNNTWNYGFGTAVVNNGNSTTEIARICVDLLPTDVAGTFLDHGSIEVGTTTGLWSSWTGGGSLAQNMTEISSTLLNLTDGTHGCIENVTLASNMNEQIGLRFIYDGNRLPAVPRTFRYQLSMEYTDGTLGSGVVYEVNVPTQAPGGGQPTKHGSPTGLNQPEDAQQVTWTVYPNPARDQVFISGLNQVPGSVTVTVTNLSGQEIWQQTLTNGEGYIHEAVNTAGWETGMYLIQVVSHEGTSTHKAHIQR